MTLTPHGLVATIVIAVVLVLLLLLCTFKDLVPGLRDWYCTLGGCIHRPHDRQNRGEAEADENATEESPEEQGPKDEPPRPPVVFLSS
ncbi:hypothetical protein M885DRAFT_571507 [Pelagophyceae sp. CCMP2097]|nr:hypothetical protein M885DRAFT_571507 [Pelagophyceae sp. CCMP2097]